MRIHLHTPPAPLSRFVDYLWSQEGDAPPHTRESVVPSGTTELVIALDDEPLCVSSHAQATAAPVSPAILCGTHASPFEIGTPTRHLLGAHFRPGGAFAFFAASAAELHDRRLALDGLWGSTAAILRERLAASGTVEGRFAVLEETLLSRMVRPLERHAAVAYALDALDGSVSIAPVVEETGLSARRFIELFRREVGLPPKLFAQVRRLQRVIGCLERPGGAAWAELALDHGFFDQPHLVRDFRRFTGLAPSAFLERRASAMNHVAVPERG